MFPLLSPLLAVLLLAALNPQPAVSLRLLTSRSVALPLGVWLAVGGGGGAALSALVTALALRQGGRRPEGPLSEDRLASEPWSAPWAPEVPASEPVGSRRSPSVPEAWPSAGPQRAPGEPAPTVSVPFRVIRRPATAQASAEERHAVPAEGRARGPVPAEPPMAAADARDDWSLPLADDEDW